MKKVLALVGLFAELSALVFVAAWMGDLIFGIVRDIRPFGFQDISYNVVQGGMVVTVALAGWLLTHRKVNSM